MSLLKQPLVTEKMSALNEKGKYGFLVDVTANKLAIKKEIEQVYQVHVKKINTMNVMGKFKSRHTKSGVLSGRRPSYKKAIVTLADGEVIDFYSNV